MSTASAPHTPTTRAQHAEPFASTYFDTVRSESIKVRTLRSFWIMLGCAIAFPVLITFLIAVFDQDDPFSDGRFVNMFAGLVPVTGLIVGAFGITALTSEYSHQTIRVTYAATPKRLRVHLAKLLVVVLISMFAQLASFLVCWVIAKIADSAVSSIISSGTFSTLIAIMATGGLITFAGYAIGLLIRNTAGAVCVLLLTPLIIESILTLLLLAISEPLVKWLPFSSLFSATGPGSSGGDEFEGVIVYLERPWAQLYFLALAGVLFGLGMYRELRRDA